MKQKENTSKNIRNVAWYIRIQNQSGKKTEIEHLKREI